VVVVEELGTVVVGVVVDGVGVVVDGTVVLVELCGESGDTQPAGGDVGPA
jgi:hypothetical protein